MDVFYHYGTHPPISSSSHGDSYIRRSRLSLNSKAKKILFVEQIRRHPDMDRLHIFYKAALPQDGKPEPTIPLW